MSSQLTSASDKWESGDHHQCQPPGEVKCRGEGAHDLDGVLYGVSDLAPSAVLDLPRELCYSSGQLASTARIEPTHLLGENGVHIALSELLRLSFACIGPAVYLDARKIISDFKCTRYSTSRITATKPAEIRRTD